MRVRDVMSAMPAHIRRDAELPEAAEQLRSLEFRHLPVVDDDGALAGIVFDHDIFARGGYLGDLWVWFEDDESSLRIRDVCHPVDVRVTDGDDLTVVLRRIAASPQDCAVVLDDGRPVGIVTEHDALRIALDALPPEVLADHESAHEVITVRDNATGPQVWEKMTGAKVRHLPVVDASGRVVGVVSLRDLISDDAAHRAEIHADDIVRGPTVYSAPPDTALRDLAKLMLDQHIGCVPLLNPMGRPVGLVTRRDVLGAAVAALEEADLFPGGGGGTPER